MPFEDGPPPVAALPPTVRTWWQGVPYAYREMLKISSRGSRSRRMIIVSVSIVFQIDPDQNIRRVLASDEIEEVQINARQGRVRIRTRPECGERDWVLDDVPQAVNMNSPSDADTFAEILCWCANRSGSDCSVTRTDQLLQSKGAKFDKRKHSSTGQRLQRMQANPQYARALLAPAAPPPAPRQPAADPEPPPVPDGAALYPVPHPGRETWGRLGIVKEPEGLLLIRVEGAIAAAGVPLGYLLGIGGRTVEEERDVVGALTSVQPGHVAHFVVQPFSDDTVHQLHTLHLNDVSESWGIDLHEIPDDLGSACVVITGVREGAPASRVAGFLDGRLPELQIVAAGGRAVSTLTDVAVASADLRASESRRVELVLREPHPSVVLALMHDRLDSVRGECEEQEDALSDAQKQRDAEIAGHEADISRLERACDMAVCERPPPVPLGDNVKKLLDGVVLERSRRPPPDCRSRERRRLLESAPDAGEAAVQAAADRLVVKRRAADRLEDQVRALEWAAALQQDPLGCNLPRKQPGPGVVHVDQRRRHVLAHRGHARPRTSGVLHKSGARDEVLDLYFSPAEAGN